MDFIIFLLLVYVVFKLGEYYSYYKISKNMVKIKQLQAIHNDLAKNASKPEPKKVSQFLVEKINNRYYGYLDNTFIGQGNDIAEVEKCLLDLIKKNPNKYHDFIIELREDSK